MTQFEALQTAKQQADTVSALCDLATATALARGVILRIAEGDPPSSDARDVMVRFAHKKGAAAFLDALKRAAGIASETEPAARETVPGRPAA